MQIGNNRASGPQPNNRNQSHLDPDLTRANREGIEDTTRVSTERTREAMRESSPERALKSRDAKDTFQRSKPAEDPGVDVSDRIKNARAQSAEQTAQRVGNARKQEAQATREPSKAKGQRIANARGQHAEAQGARAGQARKQADGVESARPDAPKRIANARSEHAERIANARAQQPDGKLEQRIENARTEYLKNNGPVDQSQATDRVRPTKVQRESVDISRASERMASDEPVGVGGSRESSSERTARVDGLRHEHLRGLLNTPERTREAAGKLLGGE